MTDFFHLYGREVKYIPALFGGAIIGVTMGFMYFTLGSLLTIFLYYFGGFAFR